MIDKTKVIFTKAKMIWQKLTDDGSITWEQEGLNEYGVEHVYTVTMKPNKEDKDLRDLVVKLDDEVIGEKTGIVYKGEEEIKSTIPLDHAQVIIDNFEREKKFKLFLDSQKGRVNWKRHKEVSGERKPSEPTIKYYNQPQIEVDEDGQVESA